MIAIGGNQRGRLTRSMSLVLEQQEILPIRSFRVRDNKETHVAHHGN